jgi:hypothetical protein
VYFVLLVAAGAILGGVVVVAMGRGGQLATFRRDVPLPLVRFRTPDEVAMAQLPVALFGYQVQATGDALAAAAALIDARDAQIAELRREIMRLGGESAGEDTGVVDDEGGGGGGGAGSAGGAESGDVGADDVGADGVGADGVGADEGAGLAAEHRWWQ